MPGAGATSKGTRDPTRILDSVKQLVAAIRTFIDGSNDHRHPSIWTETAEEVLPHATRKATSDACH